MFFSFSKFFHGFLFVNVSECICLCNIPTVRGEFQVEQLMYDSIIKLRGPSKSHKDKLIFCVSNIPYKTQDMERNT